MTFADRSDAGRQLAEALMKYKDARPVVLALPRGGVPVGYEVAKALECPLDVIVSRKLGAPFAPELAMGAVVDGDNPEMVLNQDVIDAYEVSQEFLDREVEKELEEVARREEKYRLGREAVSVEDATVIVVDDGIATGASMRAAIRGVRRRPVARLVMAVPVAPASAIQSFAAEADEVVCLHAPEYFGAVGAFYEDFGQTTDEEVIGLMDKAQEWVSAHAAE